MLTLICGLPRAGKSTFSKRYEGEGCKIIHRDNVSHSSVKEALRECSEDIVVEGIFNLSHERGDLVRAYAGNRTRCIWLDTSVEVRKHRPGYHHHYCNMPFTPPTYDEGWDEIIIIRDGAEILLER